MKEHNWVSKLMSSYRITFLIVIIFFGLGIFGFIQMPKAEFPDFVIRQGIVAAVYPGATAEEVEEQVAKPLERYLFTFDEVRRDKTTTTSSNGMCVAQVELQDYVKDKDVAWSKIKHGLNSFKTQELPSGVLALAVNDDFGSSSALLIALESDQRSYRELEKYADDLADELRRIPSVSNAKLYGNKHEQITIYVDRQRLAAYGIGRVTILQALQSAGMTTMSGSISGLEKDVPIHVVPSVSNEQEIEDQIVYTDGDNHVVRLRDVADVRREYDMTESYIQYNGHPCVLLSLEMVEGNNIVQYGKDVQKVLDRHIAEEFPSDIHVSRISDQANVVDKSVWDFMLNLFESMIIIILVMLLLFPWRTALVAGITVPLNTFISLAIMWMMGIPLNTVTLAGLILVLGMIVDNAIVVLDGYLEYLGKGMSRWEAASESAKHYFMPMALATLCISVIFFPFLLVLKGQMYDFVHWLPWTIFINLMVSLAIAVVVIPVLEYFIIKPKKQTENEEQKESLTDRIQKKYEKALDAIFRHPWLTIGGALAFIALTVALIVPNLKIRMMPVADRDQFAVEVFLPAGSGLNDTRAIVDSVYNALSQDERITGITTFVGCASPRFHTCYAPKMGGRNYAQFIINTTSNQATEELLTEYEPLYSERFPNAFVKFKQLDFQNYNPFEYRFYGKDEDSLRYVADQLIREMRKDERVMIVHSDWEEPRPIIDVTLDPVTSSQLHINRTLAELQLAVSSGSFNVGQVWEGDYQLPLVMKDVNNDELDCGDINNLYISTPGTSAVPLRQIGEAAPTWSATNLLHRGGERCITVTCDLKKGVFSQPMHTVFQQIVAEKVNIPEGVRFEVGGEPENDAETGGYIAQALMIAMAIIFFFLLFNFRKYKVAAVCLLAIVLIVPGILIGLFIMNRAVGLTAIFGVIALMGMLMRNEILIFEHADDKRKEGMSVRDAAYDAGRRRMVPIFLTTSTTAVGVVPMIIAATNFWMPVGMSIFFGGIFSLILVVTVLPVVYWKINEK